MNLVQLKFGDVREKSITTSNQFVSHMIEHIAWRLGVQIKLVWENTNWRALGLALDKKLPNLVPSKSKGLLLA